MSFGASRVCHLLDCKRKRVTSSSLRLIFIYDQDVVVIASLRWVVWIICFCYCDLVGLVKVNVKLNVVTSLKHFLYFILDSIILTFIDFMFDSKLLECLSLFGAVWVERVKSSPLKWALLCRHRLRRAIAIDFCRLLFFAFLAWHGMRALTSTVFPAQLSCLGAFTTLVASRVHSVCVWLCCVHRQSNSRDLKTFVIARASNCVRS